MAEMNLLKSAPPSEPRALIRKAAEELVAANADHGRTYDNSPDVDETARIISKWLIGAEPRRDEQELAEKLFGRITFVSEGYRSRLDSAKTISEFEKILASRASAALPPTANEATSKWCECACHEDGEPWCVECFDANHVGPVPSQPTQWKLTKEMKKLFLSELPIKITQCFGDSGEYTRGRLFRAIDILLEKLRSASQPQPSAGQTEGK